jgi:hypothetical protein
MKQSRPIIDSQTNTQRQKMATDFDAQ